MDSFLSEVPTVGDGVWLMYTSIHTKQRTQHHFANFFYSL